MFKLILNNGYVEIVENFDTVDNMVKFTYDATGLGLLSMHIKEVCNELKSGDKWENKDAGITIECI